MLHQVKPLFETDCIKQTTVSWCCLLYQTRCKFSATVAQHFISIQRISCIFREKHEKNKMTGQPLNLTKKLEENMSMLTQVPVKCEPK